MRLDKLLADMQVGTRKEIKQYIKQGHITVDGNSKVSPNQQVDPKIQTICCFGKEIKYQEYVYYMFHKPKNCVTARLDSRHRTVMDYLPESKKNLSPVGRLDLDTEGLLLITNDGMLLHNLLSPAKHVAKVYEATIDGQLKPEDIEAFRLGLDIGDSALTKPAELIILEAGDVSHVRVTITEGRYHQIKRMFASVGRQVLSLKRIAMGNLILDDTLLPGEYRELTQEELLSLKAE